MTARRTDPPAPDCVVIGGGPAGLTAATYLARFRRNVRVFDDGHSRARYIPVSHNCPGFPFGVSGPNLLGRLREQAVRYGAQMVEARVDRVTREGPGFHVFAGEHSCRAPTVLVACGISDRMPALPGIERAIAAGVVRLCAICDGYEARDVRIAVYGPPPTALRHAAFLRTFSRHVAAIASEPEEAMAGDSGDADALGVRRLPVPTRIDLPGEGGNDQDGCRIAWFGREETFDTLYPVLGAEPKAAFAAALGLRTDDNGEILVDAHMQTSVANLYAAGDVVTDLNQICVAVGHAAIAATAIHNGLPGNAL
jgi:thioredoxin reductase (NADPH)